MAMLWALAQMLGCCRNERVLHALKPKQDSSEAFAKARGCFTKYLTPTGNRHLQMTVKVKDASVNGVQCGCHIQIIEGTSDTQQLVIARAISGLHIE